MGFPKYVISLEDTLGGQISVGHIHWFILAPLWSPEVIGVAELVNKINGPWFSKFDEDLATAFSIYCGISIAHVRRTGAYRTLCSLHIGSPCSVQMGPCPALGLRALLLGCCAIFSTYWSPLASVSHQNIRDTTSCPVQLASQDYGRSVLFPSILWKQPQPRLLVILFGICWVSLSKAGSSGPGIQPLGPQRCPPSLLLSLCCGPQVPALKPGASSGVCQVPAQVLRGTGKEGQGEVWMKVGGGPLLWAGA